MEKPPVIWEIWPDGYAVYQTASGETHFLNNVGGPLLRCLMDRAPTDHRLSDCIQYALGESPSESLDLEVNPLLERFDELGLVRRTTPR